MKTAIVCVTLTAVTGIAVFAQNGPKIPGKCVKRWPNDLAMQQRCAGLPVTAVQPPAPKPVVRMRPVPEVCTSRWPTDTLMQQRCAEAEAQLASTIETCKSRWPNDLPMQQMCLQPRETAWPGEIPSFAVSTKCAKDWPDDFVMRNFCADRQEKAAATLRARSMTTGDQQTIRRKCSADWPDDYTMMNFCEEQQLKALSGIR